MKITTIAQTNDWSVDVQNLHPAEILTYGDLPHALKRLGEATNYARLDELPEDHQRVKDAFERHGLTEAVADSFLSMVVSVTQELKNS